MIWYDIKKERKKWYKERKKEMIWYDIKKERNDIKKERNDIKKERKKCYDIKREMMI